MYRRDGAILRLTGVVVAWSTVTGWHLWRGLLNISLLLEHRLADRMTRGRIASSRDLLPRW